MDDSNVAECSAMDIAVDANAAHIEEAVVDMQASTAAGDGSDIQQQLFESQIKLSQPRYLPPPPSSSSSSKQKRVDVVKQYRSKLLEFEVKLLEKEQQVEEIGRLAAIANSDPPPAASSFPEQLQQQQQMTANAAVNDNSSKQKRYNFRQQADNNAASNNTSMYQSELGEKRATTVAEARPSSSPPPAKKQRPRNIEKANTNLACATTDIEIRDAHLLLELLNDLRAMSLRIEEDATKLRENNAKLFPGKYEQLELLSDIIRRVEEDLRTGYPNSALLPATRNFSCQLASKMGMPGYEYLFRHYIPLLGQSAVYEVRRKLYSASPIHHEALAQHASICRKLVQRDICLGKPNPFGWMDLFIAGDETEV